MRLCFWACAANSPSVTAICRVAWMANKPHARGILPIFATSLNVPVPDRTWTFAAPCPQPGGHWLRMRMRLKGVNSIDAGGRAVKESACEKSRFG